MKETKNLRVEMHPYPHLRDDEGCVLANDYINESKIDYILYCIKREQHSPQKEFAKLDPPNPTGLKFDFRKDE